ncbi:MAG TPA: ribonuclease Z, partial [Bacteroidia bacterium]|nr:ribonuclease Z [Bacteroidia bacterium]
AARNAHMTADLVARLASDSDVGRLVLQHLSRRYGPETWAEMHREAKSIFPRTELPREWAAAR